MTAKQELTQGEKHSSMFAQLVISLSTSAMQHLGKMVNPATQRAEVNLDLAQSTIDMLDMLQSKTKNNLLKEEDQILGEALTSLKLTYVQVQSGQDTPPPHTPDQPESSFSEAPAEASPTIQPPPPPESTDKQEEKQPKFHKKYD